MLGGRRTLSALIATLLLAAIIVGAGCNPRSHAGRQRIGADQASQKLIHEGPPSPPDWVAGIPLIGSHIADYWNYLNESSSVRLQELARLLPAAKTIAVWGGARLPRESFRSL